MKVLPKHCEVLRVDTTAKPDKEQPKLEEKVAEKVSTPLIDITQAKLTPIQTLNTIWIRESSDEDICLHTILLAKSHPTFMENIYPMHGFNSVKIVDQKTTVGIIDRPEKTVRHFKCPHCEFTHESKGTVKKHAISKHKSSPYVCPICQEGFTNIKILSKHVKTSHPDKPTLKEPYEIVNVVANPKTKIQKEDCFFFPS